MKLNMTTTGLVLPAPTYGLLNAGLAAGIHAWLLEGEPGTGKTSLGFALGRQAEAKGGGLLFAQANAWASDEQLIRGVNLAGFVLRDPDQVWEVGLLLRIAQEAAQANGPFVAIIDEWDKTRPVADGLLLAALQEGVIVDASGHRHGTVPLNVIWWITSNGVRALHDALTRRLFRVVLPPVTGNDLAGLLRQRTGCGKHLAATVAALAQDARRSSGQARRATLPELERLTAVVLVSQDAATCRAAVQGTFGTTKLGRRPRPGDDLWAARQRDGGAA